MDAIYDERWKERAERSEKTLREIQMLLQSIGRHTPMERSGTEERLLLLESLLLVQSIRQQGQIERPGINERLLLLEAQQLQQRTRQEGQDLLEELRRFNDQTLRFWTILARKMNWLDDDDIREWEKGNH